MKTFRPYLAALALLACAGTATLSAHDGTHHESAPMLTDAQVQFLTSYEQIRAALARGNLGAAQAGATTLHTAIGDQLAKAQSLNTARIAFKKLSGEVISLVRGRHGFYVAHCPMVDADWVQRSTTISNPYVGEKMSTCGVIAN